MTNIAMQGVLFVGSYKGYHGQAEFDAESGEYHGEVMDTKDVITFEGATPTDVAIAFQESIEDYLTILRISE